MGRVKQIFLNLFIACFEGIHFVHIPRGIYALLEPTRCGCAEFVREAIYKRFYTPTAIKKEWSSLMINQSIRGLV